MVTWLQHVASVRAKNPGKSFKQCLVLASKTWKKQSSDRQRGGWKMSQSDIAHETKDQREKRYAAAAAADKAKYGPVFKKVDEELARRRAAQKGGSGWLKYIDSDKFTKRKGIPPPFIGDGRFRLQPVPKVSYM